MALARKNHKIVADIICEQSLTHPPAASRSDIYSGEPNHRKKYKVGRNKSQGDEVTASAEIFRSKPNYKLFIGFNCVSKCLGAETLSKATPTLWLILSAREGVCVE